MAQLIYLAGSLAGVGLMIALAAVLFGVRGIAMTTTGDAITRMRQDVPGFRPGSSVLDVTGSSALVESATDSALYLVRALGDGLVTRRLDRRMLAKITRNGSVLSLRLSDFTLPAAKLMFPDPATAAAWEARLRGA